jgi:hypothetical protein
MAFKLVSKNNIGIFTTLILIILLSQSNVFHLLVDTPLGRITLLAFVVFIAYTNQILGLIAVLCIAIAFNSNINIVSGYNLYEGLEIMNENEEEDDTSKKKKTKTVKGKSISKPASTAVKNIKKDSTKLVAREGFCMTDRENNMLRGKQSNSISVFDTLREQSDDVSPSDKSIFTSDYETF